MNKSEESLATLYLIPARGGSKGIPGKNIKPFCGMPLVSRAVLQALECAQSQDVVMVSTDSEEIKDIAEACGITIPFLRPEALASDTASTYSVIKHVVEEFENRGKRFEKVVLLQPTSPFRTLEDIKGTMETWTPAIDMAVSVTESKYNPYFNLFEINSEGFLYISKGDGSYVRRQDAPKVLEYNGAVYVITIESLKQGPMSKFKRIVPYVMPASRSVDLDTPEDWTIAEILFERTIKK